MIIGIEAERANTPHKTGVEHYAKQLILHLAEVDKVNSYILYLRTQPEEWFLALPKNFRIKVMPFPLFWTQVRLSWEMLLHPVDVLFIPASALPLVHPKKCVVTIHDIAWKYYPETFTPFMRWFLEWSTKFAVNNASRIIAVSSATKKDLINEYNISEEKVSVVHHGFEQMSKQIGESADKLISKLANQLISKSQNQLVNKLQTPYVLFLSTLQPRKNLERLIDAFRMLKTELPDLPHKLVVVGKPGWRFESILQKLEANKDIVIYKNYVSDRERLEILKGADVLVQPALYEGFGMQILEAFVSAVPVACSNVSSLPEVAGGAAVYFNPENVVDMKQSLKALLLDESLKHDMIQKGYGRLKEYSWEKCAKETLSILNNTRHA